MGRAGRATRACTARQRVQRALSLVHACSMQLLVERTKELMAKSGILLAFYMPITVPRALRRGPCRRWAQVPRGGVPVLSPLKMRGQAPGLEQQPVKLVPPEFARGADLPR